MFCLSKKKSIGKKVVFLTIVYLELVHLYFFIFLAKVTLLINLWSAIHSLVFFRHVYRTKDLDCINIDEVWYSLLHVFHLNKLQSYMLPLCCLFNLLSFKIVPFRFGGS